MDTRTLEVQTKYLALAQEHGPGTTSGLGWSSKGVQELRFDVMLEGLGSLKGSMLDVGCGGGDIINSVGFASHVTTYTGIDFLAENTKAARDKYTTDNLNFITGDLLEVVAPESDFVVASGTFAYYPPYNISRLVSEMWKLTEKVMVFNVMIPRTITHFSDLLLMLEVAGVKKWVIRRDYLDEDVTVYGYKDR